MSRPAPERPVTRGDCAGGPRPCRWTDCRFHLFVEYKRPKADDAITIDSIPETCALDVADSGGASRQAVGAAFGISHEMIRQIEVRALLRLRRRAGGLLDLGTIDPEAEMPVAKKDLTHPLDYAINDPWQDALEGQDGASDQSGVG